MFVFFLAIVFYFFLSLCRASFHQFYEAALKVDKSPVHHLHIACCHFYLGEFEEALKVMKNGPACQLKERLTYCINSKLDGASVRPLSSRAGGGGDAAFENLQSKLCEASVLFLSERYNDAQAVYFELIKQFPFVLSPHFFFFDFSPSLLVSEYKALNIYHAFCNYKLYFYDVAQVVVEEFASPDTIVQFRSFPRL
jgi:intraflagellar transport protein 56